MKHLRIILFLSIVFISLNCFEAKTSYETFTSNLIKKLVKYDSQKLKGMFDNVVIVRGFGEDSYSLSSKDDFRGYSKNKGPLYGALFLTKEMKNIFGYNIPCFADVFLKPKKIFKGNMGKLYYMWVVLNTNRYEFTIQKKKNKFLITSIRITEE